jgi:hypothetical protein
MGIVIFKVESNWGAEYTCLYRVSRGWDWIYNDADFAKGTGAWERCRLGLGIEWRWQAIRARRFRTVQAGDDLWL